MRVTAALMEAVEALAYSGLTPLMPVLSTTKLRLREKSQVVKIQT